MSGTQRGSQTPLQLVLILITALCIAHSHGAGSGSDAAPTKKSAPLRITKPQPVSTTIKTTATPTTAASTTTNDEASSSIGEQLAPLISSTTEGTTGSSGDGSSSYGTTAAGSLVPEICINGLQLVMSNAKGERIVRRQHELVEIIEGDVLLSVLTSDPASALFVINRVNQANLISADFEVGVRAINVENASLAENLLIQEVQYLQQCTTYSIGIFMDYDLYKRLESIIHDLEYNVWPIPTTRSYLFPKVAHLLHQMPWGEKIASVEIITETLDVYNEFMDAARQEHMCLMHFKSDDNVYILFGNKMANHFKENGTVFVVPTERAEQAFLEELPNRAFILMENEIELRSNDLDTMPTTLDEVLIGKSVLPSRILALATPIVDLMNWLRSSLAQHCKRDEELYVLESCFNFLNFIEDWRTPEFRHPHTIPELLALLHMRKLPEMNFQMYQKKVQTLDVITGESRMELREIASQNFLTNQTIYYHYNGANNTSLELKTKFGLVFNCQYTAGDNRRHPFVFDGESVMFWRIKLDTWVATGLTAAILGLIATLAILVFIVVRISLGDVFEGNPVTSILLLLSLVLVFCSFVPFSMEYVGEQRNSHVTFEDVHTLNTLCAVRVFIMTLVYCFVFSLLLCRAVMLASIGSEGGFLSHVNGYIQAVICAFSVCVQVGMSVQLLVVMHMASESVSCENIYYGRWLWGLLAYDFLLLCCLVSLVPFIYRSQRNYREGILIVIGAVLMLIIWAVWITLSLFGDEWRDAAIPLGLQASGWAVLIGILIPRTFLIVRGIERSDIAQALPSLTSLAFAQNNQYSSEQSVYECVNPAMRHCSQEEMNHQSPSEIPTLPLRGGGPRRQQFFANLRQANANINPQRPPPRPQQSPSRSSVCSLPPSPENSKITRF
ncbi:protein bride of sevenless [Drosophila nasuta]|uniref:protein bride of sevenless n=1 Tax=Drosophila nasuta TaxID=42062 RepID=UPI00295ECA49|nr:protein bride of sevenless [Drosophila nasuta]XP_060648822.1 protein bride of sevenless [Drosophila nasuta]XP_060648823.1 protein bride of sevenless [Drosophila nasuta]XP_060648824.1 protein bride of sevenless [Drosophila nasuta]XP_060648825.1 protein bride of sevenless [Drosophila nasuta]